MKRALVAVLRVVDGLGHVVTMIYRGAIEGFANIGELHSHCTDSTITPQDTKKL